MQSNPDERPAMLEQLSDWLLHGRNDLMWRELFVAKNHGGIAFGRQIATLLCADCPATWILEDAEAHCVSAEASPNCRGPVRCTKSCLRKFRMV